MDARSIIGIVSLLFAFFSLAMLGYFYIVSRRSSGVQNLMRASRGYSGEQSAVKAMREKIENDPSGAALEKLKKDTKRKSKKKKTETLDEKFFHAGIFAPQEKREFNRLRLVLPAVCTPAMAALGAFLGKDYILYGALIGFLGGLQAPLTILNRRIKRRQEDIMFYLPLVIEQIAIGVSSSLDIGPCLQRVVAMADERDSHNVVTELLRHVEFHVRSGVSMEEALNEVGRLSGHNELKHAFMALSQVAKHGGEISRQLQELADAVGSQREAQIDGKIKKLELQATGPVALVFAGFILIILIGFGLQIQGAFG